MHQLNSSTRQIQAHTDQVHSTPNLTSRVTRSDELAELERLHLDRVNHCLFLRLENLRNLRNLHNLRYLRELCYYVTRVFTLVT